MPKPCSRWSTLNGCAIPRGLITITYFDWASYQRIYATDFCPGLTWHYYAYNNHYRQVGAIQIENFSRVGPTRGFDW
ncbi:MAG: hypothetical protein ACI9MC_001249 [Kiritimatiellia bacterium]|jgi:hypothetical protein